MIRKVRRHHSRPPHQQPSPPSPSPPSNGILATPLLGADVGSMPIQLEEPSVGVRASRGRSHRREDLPRRGVRPDQLCVPPRNAHGGSPKNGASGHQGVPREGEGRRPRGDLVEAARKRLSCTSSKGTHCFAVLLRVFAVVQQVCVRRPQESERAGQHLVCRVGAL